MKDRLEVLNEAQEAVKEAFMPRYEDKVVGLYRVIVRYDSGEICGTVMPGNRIEAPIEARVFVKATQYCWCLDEREFFVDAEAAVDWCISRLYDYDEYCAKKRASVEENTVHQEVK